MHETKTLGTSELVLGYDYDAGAAYWARFLKNVVARDLPHERYLHWDSTATNVDDLLEHATHSSKLAWGSAALLDLEDEAGCIGIVTIGSGGVSIRLAAETIAALDEGEAFLRERLPVRVPTDDQTVPVSFWSYGSCGPAEIARSIDVPTWHDIRANYPRRVADQLEQLMWPDYRPDGRGQLILWYGEPGTGKTYGLRVLGWQSGASSTTSRIPRRSSDVRTTCCR